MKRVTKSIILGFAVLIIASTFIVTAFLIRSNAFYQASAVAPGKCQLLKINIGSAEDIDVDRDNGIAYLSALDRRGLVEGKKVSGNILRIKLDQKELQTEPALAQVPDSFRPHGISLYTDHNGLQRLFVINHSGGVEEKIEVFQKRLSEDLFRHVETLTDSIIKNPNDLVAVSPTKFYIASDSGATNVLESTAEMLFSAGLSPLIYFDGKQFLEVQSNLKSSGGINADLSSKRLFVGETMGKSIKVFRLLNDLSLGKYLQTIELDGAVDNLDFDPNGNLWIANHANTISLVRHLLDPEKAAPSQVQRISEIGSTKQSITTIYENDGSEFSASSVGLRYKDMILVGSITEPRLLVCNFSAIQ